MRKKILAISLILSSFFFFTGLFIGKTLAELSIGEIIRQTNELRNTMLSIEVASQLAEKGECNKAMLDELGREISKIGKELERLETEVGYKNRKVLELKEYYNLLLIRYYLLSQKVKERCGFNYSFILFFYSNKDEYRERCLEQGRYLDYVVYRLGNRNVKIFAIEGELINSTAITTLKEMYNVSSYPTLVINGKKVMKGVIYPERILQEIQR